jgi:hypothetical protein
LSAGRLQLTMAAWGNREEENRIETGLGQENEVVD